jgi:predicted Zn finger-like uncharacterized protein
MSLVTRCPACATTFRVLPAQLSARGGRVRCGKCSSAFDGVTNLLTEDAVAALPDEPSPQMGLFELRETSGFGGDDEKIPEASDPATAEAVDTIAAAPTPEVAPDAATSVRSDPLPVRTIEGKTVVPAFLASERPGAAYTLVWALLAVVALCALALQAALHFRTELGVLLPLSRAHLETACDTLGCEVRLPRRADLMSIESSDLQADGQRPGVIVLNALLRNRAPFAQEYPDLELTLTDQGDRPVIRRVLRPGEYLQEKRAALSMGMGGGAEEAVRIFLETGGILATGYQLFLFYPCPAPSTSAYWQLSYPLRCQDSRNK